MKWVTRFKDKAGLPSVQTTAHDQSNYQLDVSAEKSRDDQELEEDFKKFWEEFRSSSLEKEKERAFEMAIDVFCRLSRRIGDASPVVNTLGDARIFSFMVAKALVTEVNKLRTDNRNAPQVTEQILNFLTKSQKEETCSDGVNMLYALQCLVSPPLDVQPLIDAGLLSCLIWVLHMIFGQPGLENSTVLTKHTAYIVEADSEPLSKLMVEGSIVHIMKALAQHPGAIQNLADDNSLQLLFHIAAMRHGQFSLTSADGLNCSVSLAQLHRQALQILCLLLNSDNGITAQYIHTHQLVKVLLKVIKEFDGTIQDAEYAVDVVDIILQCVELSCRTESSVRLRDDLHNAHGYRFLVQFSLSIVEKFSSNQSWMSGCEAEKNLEESLPLVLTHLLDILVNLAQVGASGAEGMVKNVVAKSSGGVGRTFLLSDSGVTPTYDEVSMDGKVKDMEAVQVLQDIFLEARNVKLQLEILDRLLRIFSSHVENYTLCQERRTLPLFILNMPSLPEVVQEQLLKILEYAVTVVNCNLEQELLSLCCLLQQPLPTPVKGNILLFFMKLLSFDKQYKKVLREVGALEVLIDDIKKLNSLNPERSLLTERINSTDDKTLSKEVSLRSVSFSSSDAAQASPKAELFEDNNTLTNVWDFLVSMLKGTEANQTAFRKMNGITAVLPLLNSACHRNGVLRIMTCLICEDIKQSHPEDLGALIEVVKSGLLANSFGQQIKVEVETKKDVLWAIYQILTVNSTCKDVFGTATGFSILLTVLHSFQTDRELSEGRELSSSLSISHCEVFNALINVVKEAVFCNAANRLRLHDIISSQTFKDLLRDSGLLCVEYEELVADLLLGLALEKKNTSGERIVLWSEKKPEFRDTPEKARTSLVTIPDIYLCDADSPDLVFNAGAIEVVISCMKYFSFGLQLRVLEVVKRLSQACTQNRDRITAAGCISLLLEIARFSSDNTKLLEKVLGIVEILGSYRLCTAELRTLVRWMWLKRDSSKDQGGRIFLESMKRMIQLESTESENSCNVRFIEMSKGISGYSCMNISLGDRPWPPAAGYSFAFWIRYRRTRNKEHNGFAPNNTYSRNRPGPYAKEYGKIHIFSVGSTEERTQLNAELYLEESGTLCLATSNTSFLAFKGSLLEEGKWQHVVIVHNKPNILAGLFQSSTACLYVNGKLRETGKLGYSASHAGKTLQATIGTLALDLDNSMCWSLGTCYLFEEVLTSQSIFLMYALGRRYHGLFQDADLLWFLPYEACSGGNLGTFEGLELELTYGSNSQKVEESLKLSTKSGSNRAVWDLERLTTFVSQLSSKKLIFCFDGTFSDNDTTGCITLVNLLDPSSVAASPLGGLPRIARVYGDIYICSPHSLSENIRKIGGVAVVLALIEVAESKEMLRVALGLLVTVLRWSSQNAYDMSATRGYHLLALFLRQKMSHFDIQDLDLLFQIAACGTSFSNSDKVDSFDTPPMAGNYTGDSKLDRTLRSSGEEASPFGSQLDANEIFQQDMNHGSDIELSHETSILSNLEMMEHVLLDWALWVAAPVSIQLSLLGFIERLVSMRKYRTHNLTMLRRVNIVQHFLATLHRSDVEMPVLEKLVYLLGVILEDGLLISELQYVVDFVIITFEPPKPHELSTIYREPGGAHVLVRNMLLEMLIDLQVTVSSEGILEPWHKNVSSKLITFLLDEAVHPTTMRWVMTLLGVCLTSPSNFEMKFRSNGGFQELIQVLPSFFDCPEVYYILFCLVLGKDVYPRQPEVRMLDFLALLPDSGSSVELFFTDLLEAIILMSKMAFDRLCLQLNSAGQSTDQMQRSFSVDDNFLGFSDSSEQLQGEALLHKTYAARMLGGEAASPAVVTSMIRYMVDLAKICPAFSIALRRQDLLESCCDLYFSCVRAAYAAQSFQCAEAGVRNGFNDTEDVSSAQVSDSMHGRESTVSYERILVSKNEDGDDNLIRSIASNRRISDVSQLINDLDHQISETSASVSGHKPHIESKVHIEAESQFLSTPRSSISDASSLLLRPSHSTSTTPFDLSSSWVGSSSRSETNHGASTITPSASINSEFSNRQSSAGDGYLDYLYTELKPEFLLRLESLGSSGGPCSSSSAAVLDLIAEVLADALSDQIKALLLVEGILEMVPFTVVADTVLAFQGLCLRRVMNCFERRLLRDDEEANKKLDKNKWSLNLDSFSSLLVDCVYGGAFSDPGSALKVLEFLLSMLQLANKDRRVEEALVTGKSFLSLGRGIGRQVEAYVQALLKNVNRMIIYGFTSSFVTAPAENGPKQEKIESRKQEDVNENFVAATVDVSSLLQAVISNRLLIFSPINHDTDLTCCLCINSIYLLNLLCDTKSSTLGQLAGEVMKSLLTFRKPVLEQLLIVRENQGKALDVLHNGFDKLIHSNIDDFCEWFQNSKEDISKVLDQCASIMWRKCITNAANFPGIRLKQGESRRKKELSRRNREILKLSERHWERTKERRHSLHSMRNSIETDLRVIRQDKYGWMLHAESEWEMHIQHLVHERGIFPLLKVTPSEQLDWELCATEGPYRMRKKLVQRIVKIDMTCLNSYDLVCAEAIDSKNADKELDIHQILIGDTTWGKRSDCDQLHSEDIDPEEYAHLEEEDKVSSSAYFGFNNAQLEGESIRSQVARTNSILSARTNSALSESIQGSARRSLLPTEDHKSEDSQAPKYMHDDGEYLIRPFLEPGDKIRYWYNCERVAGLEKKDGLFLIGELCLYVIENIYISEQTGHICEKVNKDQLSMIDLAMGVKSSSPVISQDGEVNDASHWEGCVNKFVGAQAWAYTEGGWGRENVLAISHMAHPCRKWKLESVHEILKRRYQLRPVAIEIFSTDGCNDLLVFHKNERDEVFKNLVALNLPRNNVLDATISGTSKEDSSENNGLFKRMAKTLTKRWQNCEISNFQYLMHLNTLAGRGYNDLTQYPVYPWVLADYDSEFLDLEDPKTFRRLDKPMGALSPEREDEFRSRYENWDDPDIPQFHYGSHYSSAGTVLFYLIRLPPFSTENKKLQGGQFDHADRLFYSVKDTWLSASQGNTADVKELIPEFYYLPEMFENRFNLDFGFKQSGEKVNEVVLPPWAKGCAREFVRKHREALESRYVSENLHHWIDLIFGYQQQGQAAVDATNVFYHLTYEDAVDIDSIQDPNMKASLLAQINNFGQTPKQLFQKPHPKRGFQNKLPRMNVLSWHNVLVPQEIRTFPFPISQVVYFHDKVLASGLNRILKPRSYEKYVAWGFPDKSLRIFSYEQDKLLSTHEGLHGNEQIQCTGFSRDGRILVTGGEDGMLSVWRLQKQGAKKQHYLVLQRTLCAHPQKITCLAVCQPYSLIVSGSEDCSVILWDLSSLRYVRQLPILPSAASAVHANEMTGNIITAAGTTLAVWSINGDCLATVNTSQLPSDTILSVTNSCFSDWMGTDWFITGHQSGSVKIWHMDHCSLDMSRIYERSQSTSLQSLSRKLRDEPESSLEKPEGTADRSTPEYKLTLLKVLKWHKHAVTCVHVTSDLKLLFSGDSEGHLVSWILPEDIDTER